MAEILVLGAGVVGLGTALLLAGDGHKVTVLERDPEPPPELATDAWAVWQRRGVNQFRLPHFFLARYRTILDQELPGIAAAVEKAAGCTTTPCSPFPKQSGARPARKMRTWTCSQAVGRSSSLSSLALSPSTRGLTVRRGATLVGLVTGPPRHGVLHVQGARTARGEELAADLVVDLTGRSHSSRAGSSIPAAGRRETTCEDSGFIYYSRHYRSPMGRCPRHLAHY